MANALKEIEHAQRLCDRGDITIGEYFDLVEKWEDAEPIKHGHWTRWLDTRFGRLLNDIIICSNCNVAFSSEQQIRRSYCPNCGAKMDEVEE